jgi:import inner membrane translocase subunit TIM44
VSSTIASTTEPIRNTAAYKTLSETLIDALDDSGSAKHAGFEEKEVRRKRRQMRLEKAGKVKGFGRGSARVVANPTFVFPSLFRSHYESCFRAGSSVVLHKDSARQEAWNSLKETNPILRSLGSLRQRFDESENPVISSLRNATYTVASWFDENETAQVMRAMKLLDPTFTREAFERELREYIVPEVVDAYLSADHEALKEWCSEAVRPFSNQNVD